jgi:hypothetical protein
VALETESRRLKNCRNGRADDVLTVRRALRVPVRKKTGTALLRVAIEDDFEQCATYETLIFVMRTSANG